MGEDALHVELPKATGEAGGSRPPARPVPPYNRIEPLRLAQDPGNDRRRRILRAIRLRDPGPGIEAALRFGNPFQRAQPAPEIPEAQLPQLQPNIEIPRPIGVGQHVPVQEAVEQRGEDLQQHQEDVRVQRRRLLQQQRALAEKFAGNNLRNPPPALPDDPIHPIPRLRGNRAGGVRMDPMDRGRIDQWRRGVPDPKGPEEGAVL